MIPIPSGTKLIVIGVIAIGAFLYVRSLQISRDHWRLQHDQVQATLNTERASHKKAAEEAEAQRKADLADALKIRDSAQQHLQDRVAFHAAAADGLRKRLRDAERDRLRPLAHAADAPADCRNYESDPTRLSESHREFLIGEAVAAEGNIELLEACRKDYSAALITCGIKTE